MKKRLLLRMKDKLFSKKDTQKIPKLLLALRSEVPDINIKTEPYNVKEYKGVHYYLEKEISTVEHNEKTLTLVGFNLHLKGITLPSYHKAIINELVQDVFTGIMGNEGLDYRFVYHKDNSLCVSGFKDVFKCNTVAREIIDVYTVRKNDLENILEEVDLVYPITKEECGEILEKVK